GSGHRALRDGALRHAHRMGQPARHDRSRRAARADARAGEEGGQEAERDSPRAGQPQGGLTGAALSRQTAHGTVARKFASARMSWSDTWYIIPFMVVSTP